MNEIIESIISEITIDDLPNEDLKLIAEIIGLKQAILLAFKLTGANIAFPISFKKIVRKFYIQKNYNGSNARRLALLLGMSERTVYYYLNQPLRKVKVK